MLFCNGGFLLLAFTQEVVKNHPPLGVGLPCRGITRDENCLVKEEKQGNTWLYRESWKSRG